MNPGAGLNGLEQFGSLREPEARLARLHDALVERMRRGKTGPHDNRTSTTRERFRSRLRILSEHQVGSPGQSAGIHTADLMIRLAVDQRAALPLDEFDDLQGTPRFQ
jgi:hypothetical protein